MKLPAKGSCQCGQVQCELTTDLLTDAVGYRESAGS